MFEEEIPKEKTLKEKMKEAAKKDNLSDSEVLSLYYDYATEKIRKKLRRKAFIQKKADAVKDKIDVAKEKYHDWSDKRIEKKHNKLEQKMDKIREKKDNKKT